jgi:GT2 family glycosyltransferase
VTPSASIVIPTRGRRDYLAVTLASVAPQAAAHGTELIVVHDEREDSRVGELVERHGGRYLVHGESRGPNAARNTGFAVAGADLLILLDDDIEAWDGWLGALLDGAAANPEHDVLGGPIRGRLEDFRLPTCGREAPPVTTLDLGPHDTDARLVWSANMALRRRALDRAGLFDAGLAIYGDEEEWQLRHLATGGRTRYIAAAGVDHRRAGADARLTALMRAEHRRGRNSRRYGLTKGERPPLTAELKTFGATAAHAVRFGCAFGPVMAAHSAGRIREALAPRPPLAGPDPDFLSGESGTLGRRTAALGMARDIAVDLALLPRRALLRRAARALPPRKVHAVAIARPERAGSAAAAAQELERSRHEVAIRLAPAAPGAGKWANLNAALRAHPVGDADWLLVFDDDVVLPHGFLDTFLFLCERFGFTLAQPAHKFWSNAAWRVTRRRPGSVARRTRFVEIGPVTAIHRRAFDVLLPFPDLHMGWGLDNHWGAVAAEHGWKVGIVDATPVRHTRPVAGDYPRADAVAEAVAFLATRPYVPRHEVQETLEAHRGWR